MKHSHWAPIALVLLLAACANQPQATGKPNWATIEQAGPGGARISCVALEDFGNRYTTVDQSAFGVPLMQWDKDLPAFLISTAQACQQNYLQVFSQNGKLNQQNANAINRATEHIIRKIQVADRSISIRRSAVEQQVRQQDERREREAQDAAKSAEQADRQRTLAACQQTKEYKFFIAESLVIQSVENLQGWQESAKQEARISRESGVRNLSRDYTIAQWKLEAKDSLDEAWANYKKAGGKASSPYRVKQTVNDPCASPSPKT